MIYAYPTFHRAIESALDIRRHEAERVPRWAPCDEPRARRAASPPAP